MLKPRCGFYITDKFPKVPKYNEKGWEVSIPDGAVVFYDMEAFIKAPDEEVLKYCKELIEHFNLAFEPKELMDMVALVCINESLPKDEEEIRRIIERIPGIELEPEEREDA